MNKRKVFALVISLVLVIAVALPGTLAVSVDRASGSGTIEVFTDAETSAPVEPPTDGTADLCTCDPQPTEGEAHQAECPQYTAPEQPADTENFCTCDPQPTEGEAHQAECPLYTAPEPPVDTENTDNYGLSPEGEKPNEGGGLYIAPEQHAASAHSGACGDDCADAACECACHLFDRIMACTTLEEIWVVLDAAPEEAIAALTEEQLAQIDAKIEALEPAPAPAVVIEESHDETVPSEIVYPTVTYTDVAPLGEPVTGGHR